MIAFVPGFNHRVRLVQMYGINFRTAILFFYQSNAHDAFTTTLTPLPHYVQDIVMHVTPASNRKTATNRPRLFYFFLKKKPEQKRTTKKPFRWEKRGEGGPAGSWRRGGGKLTTCRQSHQGTLPSYLMGCAYPTDCYSKAAPPPPRRRSFSCRQPRVGSSRVSRLLPTPSSFIVTNAWWAEKNLGNHEYLKTGVLVQSDGLGPVVGIIYLLARGRIKPGEQESRQPDTPLLSRGKKRRSIRERAIWEDRRNIPILGNHLARRRTV